MPEFSPTTPPGLLLATDLHGQPANQRSHSLASTMVCNIPVAPGDARSWRAAFVTRAPGDAMYQPKTVLRLCARRYMSHCPEG